MRIVKSAVERVRREVAQIFLVQLAQCSNHRPRFAHRSRGKSVGLIFVTTRPEVLEWREPERDHAAQQTEQEKGGCAGARSKPKRLIEPRLVRNQRNDIKADEQAGCRPRQHFGDMFFLVVPDLVGEHRFQFRLGQLLNQGVVQHDFPEPAEAGEERVRMA